MNRLGFKNSLVLAVALWTILSVSICNLVSYLNQKKGINEEVTGATLTYVKDQARSIEDIIKSKVSGINYFSNLYRNYKYNDRHVDRVIEASGLMGVDNLTISFENGDAYQSDNSDTWLNHKNPPSYDPRVRPWWNDIKDKSGVIFTNVYLDAGSNRPLVSFGEDFGNGIILADLDLEVLNKTVERIDIPGSISIIIDEDTRILATSVNTVKNGDLLTNYANLRELAKATVTQKSIIKPYLNSSGIEKTMFTHEIELNNKKWFLMVGLNDSLTYAMLDQSLNQSIVATLLIILIGVPLSIIVLNKFYVPIVHLKNTLQKLAKGDADLTQRLEVKSNDDLGEIASGVNTFVANVQRLMLQVQTASDELNGSVCELKQQSESNVKLLSQQSMETEQVVAGVEEMNCTASDVAKNANNTAQLTKEATTTCEQSVSIFDEANCVVASLAQNVDKASHHVNEVSNSSQNINSILNVIGEITEQTNLLALNAAIEAARAGEHGRGFAVVADEVRNLAYRTKESTQQIESVLDELLKGNQSMVESMTETKARSEQLVTNTAEVKISLRSMNDSIGNINDHSLQIATAAEQQNTVTLQMSQSIAAIGDLADRLDQAGSITSDKTEVISNVSLRLSEVVARFKLS